MQRYTADRIDQGVTPVERYGAFFVEQGGSLDEIVILNHRTAARFTGRRAPR